MPAPPSLAPPPDPSQPLPLATAKELLACGGVRAVELVGQPGGYTMVFHIGPQRRVLGKAASKTPRLFAKLDAATTALRGLGVAQFVVDASQYSPGLKTRQRPDSREQLRAAHAAAAHRRWMLGQVREALDNPRPVFVDEAAAFDELDRHAAMLLREPVRGGLSG